MVTPSQKKYLTKGGSFFFKDESHYCRVKINLFSVFQTGEFSDITIIVSGKEFHCHKNILAANSPYFQAMFGCEMKEKKEKIIKIESIDSKVFSDVIHYMYNGELNITSENAQSLLECADMLQLEELKVGCCQYFAKYLNAGNCLGIWNLAAQFHDKKLLQAAWKCALSKFSDVVNEEEFANLTVGNLNLYLGDSNLNASSEENVCDAVLKWLSFNPKHSESDITDIFSAIRISNLDVVYIKTHLLTNSLIQKSTQIVDTLNGLLDNLLYNFPLPYSIPILMPRLHTVMRSGIMIFGGCVKNSEEQPVVKDCIFIKHESRTKVCVTDTITSVPAFYCKGVASCVIDGVVYLSGRPGLLNIDDSKVLKYKVNTEEWLACSEMNIGRIWHSMVRGYKDKIYILGGIPNDGEASDILKQVEEYLIERNIWENIGHLNVAVYAFGAIFHRGNIYTFGGYTNQQTKTKCKVIQAFNTATNQCSVLEWELPFPSCELIPIGLKNWAILLGKDHNYVIDLEKLGRERQTFSVEDMTEEDMTEEESLIRVLPGVGYTDFGAELLGDQIFVMGGVCNEGNSSTVLTDILIADVQEFIDFKSKNINWFTAGSFEDSFDYVLATAVVKLYSEGPQTMCDFYC